MNRHLHITAVAAAVIAASHLAGWSLSPALAQDSPTTNATAPAGDEEAGRFIAEAKTMPSPIRLEGVFEPADPLEVKVELDAFSEDLEVTQVAGHGAAVRAGDVLMAVSSEDLQKAIEEAGNRKALADIDLDKAQVDADLGEQADALAARVAQRKLENAEQALSWFESVDGQLILQNADLMVERAQDSIEDQQDELDQLQKMYKSEELTEETADIVVKRALRRLRQSKEQFELTRERARKMREKDYADARQNHVDALDRQKLEIAQLNNDQAARKVQREAAMLSARSAAEDAAEALADLQADAEKLTVTAPSDGRMFFGQLNDGNWSGASDDALKVGDDIKPNQAVATFFQPGRMQIVVDLPEIDRFRVSEGASVTVTPAALPDVEMEGQVARISPLVLQKGPNRVFQVTVELPSQIDERIAPGFTGTLEIAAEGKTLPMVPLEYVKGDKLRVERDGEWQTVPVKTGQKEQGMVQITEGIEAGEAVLPAEEPESEEEEAATAEEPTQE